MKEQRIALALAFIAVVFAIFTLWKTGTVLDASIEKQAESNRLFLTETVDALKKMQPQPATAPVQTTPSTAALLGSAPVVAYTGDVVANVFDEPNSNPDDAAKLNKMKADFESLFVTYQYLAKCGLAVDTDYHLLNSALIHQMSSLNTPSRVQFDILTAAKGTYDEIYARSPCDTPDIGTMQQQFKNYLLEAQKNRFVM